MRQLSIANEDAQTPGVEKRLEVVGNAVDDAGEPERIVRSAPWFAVYRDTYLRRAVDVGVIPRLEVAVVPAGAGEHPQSFRNLLLEVETHARPAVVVPHGVTTDQFRKSVFALFAYLLMSNMSTMENKSRLSAQDGPRSASRRID
jgi:hypothetical protein